MSNSTVKVIHLVAYSPSSPHRLQDLARLAFSMNIVTTFIAVKPVGMAAQVGIPEVFRLAYRLDKRFLVLPRLQDLKELIGVEDVVFITSNDSVADLCEVEWDRNRSTAIVVQAGETPFTKDDLALGRAVRLREFEGYRLPNPVAEATIALLKLSRILLKGTC